MSITKIIAKSVSNYRNSKSIGTRLRKKRIMPLILMIKDTYEKEGRVNILDIGGIKNYWNIIPKEILEQNNVRITILNLSRSKKPVEEEPFIYIEGDGCDLSEMENNSFDIVHSNSVIEHVGDWSRMVQFSKEVKRLSNSYFVQTPNYWFPVEPHSMVLFFHWLPKPLRVLLVMKFNLGHWTKKDSIDLAVRTVERTRLLDKMMFQELFREAYIVTEKFFFLQKSFIAIKCETLSPKIQSH